MANHKRYGCNVFYSHWRLLSYKQLFNTSAWCIFVKMWEFLKLPSTFLPPKSTNKKRVHLVLAYDIWHKEEVRVSPGRRSCGPPASASGWSPRPAWPSRCGTGGPGRWSSAAGRQRAESRYIAAWWSLPPAPPSRTSPRSVGPPFHNTERANSWLERRGDIVSKIINPQLRQNVAVEDASSLVYIRAWCGQMWDDGIFRGLHKCDFTTEAEGFHFYDTTLTLCGEKVNNTFFSPQTSKQRTDFLSCSSRHNNRSKCFGTQILRSDGCSRSVQISGISAGTILVPQRLLLGTSLSLSSRSTGSLWPVTRS